MSDACWSGESSSPTAAWIPPWALAVLHDAFEPFVTCRTSAPERRAAQAAERPAPPAPTTSTSVVLPRSGTAQSLRGSCKNGGCEPSFRHHPAKPRHGRRVVAACGPRARVLVRERALGDPLARSHGCAGDRDGSPPPGARP